MPDPIADSQLELACRLGAIDDILEALEDGADINCNGSAPIFGAVMAGERSVTSILVEKGADISAFELSPELTEVEDIVDVLLQLAPKPAEEEPAMEKVDPKQVRAFDRMIRNKGMGEPFLKKRGDEYPAVLDALETIAAEECHAAVAEFLQMVNEARGGESISGEEAEDSLSSDEVDANEEQGPDGERESTADAPDEASVATESAFDIKAFLECKAERVAELSERYVSAEDLPGDLLKEDLKEMKKLSA